MIWLIGTALRARYIVVALACVLVIVAMRVVPNTPLDVFPEFAPPRVEIQTEVPGLSAADVEALVTVPIENAMNGVSWLKTIRSKSVLGLSSVILLFEDDVDLFEARQLVAERLSIIQTRLPVVANTPVILAPLSSTSRVLKIGMQSETQSQMDMTTLALWTIRPRLMALPGVANVAIWGQRDKQLQVIVDPDRLHANGVSLQQVLDATGDATSLTGGSFIEGPVQRLNVTHQRSVNGPLDLASAPIAYSNGSALTIGDVANVQWGSPPPIGDGIINDEPGLLLIVEKQPWGNTLAVTRAIENTLVDLAPALDGIEVDSTIFRPATYVENALANLNKALLIGCLLVILVLIAFLAEWRTTVISVVAIPLSLLTAALALRYAGGSIDTMVLAGLIIALGEVVDDAIIDVENIMRRLRLNRQLAEPLPAWRVVLSASLEVRTAVVFGSVIVVMVLVPVFMISGLTGTFFQPLAMAYIVAIAASLIVALTVTPALCLILLPRAELVDRDRALVRKLKQWYRPVLIRMLKRPVFGFASLGSMLVLGAAIYPMLGQQLLPDFREYDFLMHWLERPGTSLDAMNRVTIRVSKELRTIDGVRNFGAHVGRAEVADEVVGIDFTELWISLDPEVDYDNKVAEIQEVVDGYPGLFRDLLTYLRERIKEVLTGTSATIVVRIFGPDLDGLERHARMVERRIDGIEGVIDLSVQHQTLIPEIVVRLKEDVVATLGVTAGDVRRSTQTLLTGSTVGEIYDQQKVFSVVVRGDEKSARNIDELRRLMIETRGGGMVPLNAIADVFISPTPNQITREAGSRRIDVSLNVSDRSLDDVAGDVADALSAVSFEQGYYPEVLGEYAELASARLQMTIAILIIGVGIFLLLHTVFESARIASMIFLGLPAALFGGVIGAVVGGGVLSLGSLVGFITVLGISARNGIMLVSHYRHLELEEGMPFDEKLALRGAEERLVPILMTALTTCLALLPLVAGGVQPGHEIEHPMAMVIIGGLISSALVNLLVVPMLYLRYSRAA